MFKIIVLKMMNMKMIMNKNKMRWFQM